MGEDLVIAYHLWTRGYDLSRIRYLDIGACDPKSLSNTYLFYRAGASGVLVEPNSDLNRQLTKARPRDRIINVGVAKQDQNAADFFVANMPTLSTFSKEEADFLASAKGREAYGSNLRLTCMRQVPLVSINTIIAESFGGQAPELVSIDTEGTDEEIVFSLDYDRFTPYTICVEVNTGYEEIRRHLEDRNYVLIGYNQLNAIFMQRRVQ